MTTKNIELMRKPVNKRIEELRKSRGLKQEEFGARLGKGRSAINNWEQGLVQVKSDDLIGIAKEFSVSADYLLGLRDDESNKIEEQTALDYTGLSPESLRILHELKENQPREFEALDKLLSDADFYLFVLWETAEYFNSRMEYNDEEKRVLSLHPADIASFHAERAGRMLSTLLEQRDPLRTYNSKFVQAAAAEVFTKAGKKEGEEN